VYVNEIPGPANSTATPVAVTRPEKDEKTEPASHPLRIALIAPPYFEVPPAAYGGVEAVLGDLANGLTDLGHDVLVFGCGRSGTRATFHQVWENPIPELLGDPGAEVIYAATVRRAVAETLGDGGLDLVHDHTCAGPLNAPAFAALGLPTVATVHGPVDKQMRLYYQALGQDVGLVAISRRQRHLAPGLNWVGTVHNGLHPADWPFETRKEDYGLFLGRFHPDKGAHTALDAAHDAGIPLVLAGKCAEPAEREYFAKEVEPRLWLTDEVIGVADATVKRKLLSRARCLVFPVQWEEPFGMVMIEAMICGTPVVALRSGAVPEVVVPGVTGIICDHPADLPEAIREAEQLDPQACRQHVIDNFSALRMATGYVSAYRTVLTHHRAAPHAATVPSSHPAAERRRWARRLAREELSSVNLPGPGR
jgi:glycosyltransferase involved in cell wall biosynthesis